MTGTRPDRLGHRVGAAVLALALVILLSSCNQSVDGGTVVPSPLTTVAPSTTIPSNPAVARPAPVGPELVAWGADGRLLSLVVRNRDEREISAARVLIRVFAKDGSLITATTGARSSKCCTILGLPPGAEFGLFLDLHRPAREAGRVEVSYDRVDTVAWPRRHPTRITVHRARLARSRGDAVVTATLATHGPAGPYLVGQAFLDDARGRLVAVISGRFYCFRDGTTKRLRMHLLHGVPPHTHLRKVVGYVVPPGQPSLVRDSCN